MRFGRCTSILVQWMLHLHCNCKSPHQGGVCFCSVCRHEHCCQDTCGPFPAAQGAPHRACGACGCAQPGGACSPQCRCSSCSRARGEVSQIIAVETKAVGSWHCRVCAVCWRGIGLRMKAGMIDRTSMRPSGGWRTHTLKQPVDLPFSTTAIAGFGAGPPRFSCTAWPVRSVGRGSRGLVLQRR